MSGHDMSYMISATEKILKGFLFPEYPEIEDVDVKPYSDDRVMVVLKVKRGSKLGRFRGMESKIKSLVPMIGGRASEVTIPDTNQEYYYLASVVFFSKPFKKF